MTDIELRGYTRDQVTPTLRVASQQDVGTIVQWIQKYWEKSPYNEYNFNKDKLIKHAQVMLLERMNYIFLLSVAEDDPEDIKGMLIGVKRQFPFSDDFCSIELFWFVENEDKRRSVELFRAFEGWSKLVGCRFAQFGKLSMENNVTDDEVKPNYKQMETIFQKRIQ